jgi:LysR family hydrogen peroxide-inducible transcriptional activator
MVSLTQMEYVLAVEKFRHFSQAAKSCNVSQPSLSMQLQKAEDFIGVVIFDRSKAPIAVTEQGQIIIDQFRSVLREYKKVFTLVSESEKEISGDFVLGVIPTLAPYVIPLFIEKFCQKYPKVNLTIEELKTETIISRLSNDLLDGGLLVTPLHNDKLIERSLFLEPLFAYVSPKSKLAKFDKLKAIDLKEKGLWILNEGHCFRDQVFNLCSYVKDKKTESIYENLLFESGSLETLKRIVDKGSGHTVLPFLATSGFGVKEKSKLREFKGARPMREVSLVHSRIDLKERILSAIEDCIVECLPKGVESHKSTKFNILEITPNAD